MAECPCCKQPVEDAKGPIEMATDGLPVAVAIFDGLGLPTVSRQGLKFRVLLNGEPTNRCVGFDRRDGRLWRYQADATGTYMRRDDEFVIEQLSGEITLEPTNT